MSDFTRAEQCGVALAECLRGDGEKLVSPIGTLPQLGARLAKLTFEPDILMTDGVASIVSTCQPLGGAPGPDPIVESWMPYRAIFECVSSGRRHVIMGATQIDRFGNQNIACIGDFKKPKAQLLGMRGAPGNTINHTTSYFVPNHSPKVFVEKVDVVSGVGYDRAAKLGKETSRFHEIRRVVSNLCVLDFGGPDHAMRLVSTHTGVSVDDVIAATGFDLVIEDVVETRAPSADELTLMRETIDPTGAASKEVKG
ncbi:MAG: acyl CoA:acetate/3-ketoacid CoA transferase beta subunit [Myxococcota bacterium]|jgi:acyl CoA:acetate/3-ketoacid CoA transferase beta subunit